MFVPAFLVAALWFGGAYLHIKRPKTMFYIRHWPFGPREDPGETVAAAYRRIGYFLAALGVPFLLWGLVG